MIALGLSPLWIHPLLHRDPYTMYAVMLSFMETILLTDTPNDQEFEDTPKRKYNRRVHRFSQRQTKKGNQVILRYHQRRDWTIPKVVHKN